MPKEVVEVILESGRARARFIGQVGLGPGLPRRLEKKCRRGAEQRGDEGLLHCGKLPCVGIGT